MKFTVTVDGKEQSVEVRRTSGGWNCRVNGEAHAIDVAEVAPGRFSLLLDGASFEVHVEEHGEGHGEKGSGQYRVHTRGADLVAEVEDPRRWQGRGGRGGGKEGRQEITAPMPGKVITVLVEKGQKVEEGQGLVVVEAMKMQNESPSPKPGVIEKVLVQAGDTVEHGSKLVVIS